MSDTTSPGLDEWSSHTEPTRSPVQPQHPTKKRRTGSHSHASQEIGLMRNSGKSGSPRFIGSGSGIHFIRTVYDVLARSALGSRPVDRIQVRGDLVPGEDDELVDPVPEHVETPGTKSRAPFWQQDEIVEDAAQGAPLVSFDNLVQWTKSYFENWHPAFPFLHGPEVLETFEKVALVGIGNISEPEATIVRSIVSISLADSRQMRAHQTAIPTSLIFLNQEHIATSMVYALGCPASLKSIQAAVCVQLFLVSMLKFNMASRMGGIIVRMSFHLGLYRCPVRYPNFNTHEAAMRKRVWWSIYCLERIVCQSLGHPLGIVDDDSDVCLPIYESHRNSPGNSFAEDDPLLLLTLLSKHARIRGLILELRHKSIAIRHDTMDRAMLVQSELAKWANDVHEKTGNAEFEKLEDHVVTNPMPPSQRTLLSIMHHESIITLNRPLLASHIKTPASQAALQACISASRSLIDIIITKDPQQSEISSHNIMVWPLLTWSVWMSCFILAYAALEGETTISSAQKYAKKALYILKQLSARGTTWPESCARGVEHLVFALQRKQEEGRVPHTEKQTVSVAAVERSHMQNSSNMNEKNGVQTVLQDQDNQDRSDTTARACDSPIPTLQVQDLTPITAGFSQSDASYDPQYRNPFDMTQYTPGHNQLSMVETDLYGQDWFDPLGALDFSNFAQVGTTDSTLGFGFF